MTLNKAVVLYGVNGISHKQALVYYNLQNSTLFFVFFF